MTPTRFKNKRFLEQKITKEDLHAKKKKTVEVHAVILFQLHAVTLFPDFPNP